MSGKAHIKAQAKYDKNNTRSIMLKLNLTTDADILAKLDDVPNKQGYVKELLRRDIKGSGETLSVDAIRYLIQPVAKRFGLKRVFLFGSYARGGETAESDLDFLVDGGKVDTIGAYFDLKAALEKATGKGVDVVMGEQARRETNTRAGQRFLQHFERDKVLLYEQIQ